MLGLKAQRLIAKLLKLWVETEVEAERMRQRLAHDPDFEPYGAFKALDKRRSGIVSAEDLDYALEGRVHISSLLVVLRHWDTTGRGSLQLSDFIELVLPNEPQLRLQVLKRRPLAQGSPESFRGLCNLLSYLTETQESLEQLRIDLTNEPEFTVVKAFNTIRHDTSSINRQDLQLFLVQHRVYLDREELDCLWRLFKPKGQISFEEFEFSIAPSF